MQSYRPSGKMGRFVETTEGELKAPPMLAFGLDQGNKIRPIVDERFKNLLSAFPEKIKLSGVRHIREAIVAFCAPVGREQEVLAASSPQSTKDMFLRIDAEVQTRKCKGAMGAFGFVEEEEQRLEQKLKSFNSGTAGRPGGGVLPHLVTKDWKKAYFQVGVDVPENNPAQAWDNESSSWKFFLACVLNMENLHSVPSWCRIAELAMFIMEKWLWCPCLTYIDDSTLVSVDDDIDDCAAAFDALSKALGLVRSPKEESNMCTKVTRDPKILGLIFCREQDCFVISVPEKKLKDLVIRADELVKETVEKRV